MNNSEIQQAIEQAAEAVSQADALLVCAGAGMGVDSGLPDFRGNEGFWNAYPAFAKLGLNFYQLANPQWFSRDPELAWGFYGHRLSLYRATQPHRGFQILLDWAGRMKHKPMVFTSNVDGHFQRAGFDAERIVECHGSIHHLQCVAPCSRQIWRGDGCTIDVDEATMRARPPLPTCPQCGVLARPNILMFGDWNWTPERNIEQQRRFGDQLRVASTDRLVIVECGAGSAVPTVRGMSEGIARESGARLVRINPREPDVPPGQISVPLAALEALTRIGDAIGND